MHGRHPRRVTALAVAALALAPGAAGAQDREVTVTVYNSNLALVKDRRRVDLTGGIQRLSFIDVSAQIRPETALLSGGGVSVPPNAAGQYASALAEPAPSKSKPPSPSLS